MIVVTGCIRTATAGSRGMVGRMDDGDIMLFFKPALAPTACYMRFVSEKALHVAFQLPHRCYYIVVRVLPRSQWESGPPRASENTRNTVFDTSLSLWRQGICTMLFNVYVAAAPQFATKILDHFFPFYYPLIILSFVF